MPQYTYNGKRIIVNMQKQILRFLPNNWYIWKNEVKVSASENHAHIYP